MQQELFPITSEYKDLPVKDLPEFKGANPTPQMIASVKKHGVLQPVLLKGNTFVAGRRRLNAARAAGLETIPARCFPDDFSNEYILSLVENEQRRNNPVSDLKSVEELINEGKDEKTITQETGISPQRLKKILAVQKLIPHLRHAFNDGVIKYTVAIHAAKKPESVQKMLLKKLEDEGTLKLKDVLALSKVQKKAAINDLPDSLFGNITPTWKPNTRKMLQDARKTAEKDANQDFLNNLDKLIEELI
jgi:ParB/RepB/Spo0J family partition protein